MSDTALSAPPLAPAAGRHALPLARDRWLLAVLAATAVCLAVSWLRERGYQIADSVEYMERARAIARGEALIDNQAIRSFGFSGLLLPFFLLAELFGIQNGVVVLVACQLLQIALSVALVWASAEIGFRLAGRAAGLAAALVVGFSPILLRWGIEPVSGVAAALFVALGVRELLGDERTRKTGLRAGLWLGAGILMAYQTIPLVGVIALFIVARDLRRARAHAAGVMLGIGACVLLQCLLDLLYYGSFGVSVSTYLYQNFGVQFARLVVEVAQLTGSKKIYDLSSWIYNYAVDLQKKDIAIHYQEEVKQSLSVVRASTSKLWYLVNISKGVPYAAAALFAIGALRAAFTRSWKPWFVLIVFAINLAAYSIKASKDFRLWLPLLPLIGPLAGLGFAALAGLVRESAGRAALSPLRILAALGLLLAACYAGVRADLATNTRRYGAFWDAIALVNRETTDEARRVAAAGQVPGRPLISCAWHWSVFLRQGSDVELIKLPHHLDYWDRYSEAERAEDLAAIASLEYFITHLPVLTEHPDLFAAVNRDFAVHAVFYDRLPYEGLGPIYVLEKRTGAPGEATFFDRVDGAELEPWALAHDIDPDRALRFAASEGGRVALELVDATYRRIDGDGHGWITYTWYGGPFPGQDWTFVDRLTSAEDSNAWQNNHAPAYGLQRTASWGEGTILREGYLVVAEVDPFRALGPTLRFGGEHRRGDLIPATLWMDVAQLDAEGRVLARLESCDAAGRPLRDTALPGRPPLWRGACISADGMTRATSFLMPVHERARFPDNGVAVPLQE
jgi:4-amino-4-deoxy-L-arabinose transferase-like glycosyltransferase